MYRVDIPEDKVLDWFDPSMTMVEVKSSQILRRVASYGSYFVPFSICWLFDLAIYKHP
jgi:hypothetical protein